MMAYFSTGSEGDDYQLRWCQRCIHWPESAIAECPVWTVQGDYNYERVNEPEHAIRKILDILIPSRDDGFPDQCRMFHSRKAAP